MSRWRPSPDEERWLEVASRLGSAVPSTALAERTGGWRTTGPLARIALFVLGFVAAALLIGVLGLSFGLSDEHALLMALLLAGFIAAIAAEWLSLQVRFHASGIEEGLTVAGFLMIGLWLALKIPREPDFGYSSVQVLVLIFAVGVAGLRRLNPIVTTGAVIAFVAWVGSTEPAQALDRTLGDGRTAFTFACALAALALVLGGRDYRRPSHDRMLDWLVATLPVFAYAQHANRGAFGALHIANGTGTTHLAAVALLLVLGAALLATGLQRRRHAPLWGFLGCVVALALELRAATGIASETLMIICGLAALVAGVALDRYLREPRNGLTSAAFTKGEGPLDLLQMAGAALLGQRTDPAARPTEPGFEGGGGKFGGGGASGSY